MADDTRLSGYTRRVLIAAGVVVGTVAAIYFLWQQGNVFMLIFAGVLFAVILSGLTNVLVHRASLPRGVAMTIVIAVTISLLGGFGVLAGPRLANQGSELAKRIPEAIDQLQQQTGRIHDVKPGFICGATEPRRVGAHGACIRDGEGHSPTATSPISQLQPSAA